MNKALVTAMLLGLISADADDEAAYEALRGKRAEAAPNAEDCEDAATATARAAKARAEGEKALLDTEKARLDDLLVAEKAIHAAMKVNSDAADDLTTGARDYLDVAQAAMDAATSLKSDNAAIEAAEAAGIATLTGAKSTADGAVNTINGDIATVTTENGKLSLAEDQHKEEQTTLTAAWQAKVDLATAKTLEKTTAEENKAKAEEESNGCASDCKTSVQDGTKKILEDATSALTAAEGLVTNYKLVAEDKTEAELLALLITQNKIKVRQEAYKASKIAACAAISVGADCNVGDGITELDAAVWAVASWPAYTTAKSNHDTAIAALAELKAKVLIAAKDKETATTNDTAKTNEISGFTTTIGATISDGLQAEEAAALAAVVDPLAAKNKIDAQYANAVIEHTAGKARLAALQVDLEDAKVTAANAAAALTAGSVADAAAKVKVAEADVEIARLTPYLAKAKNAGTRASAYYNFYNQFTVDAKSRVDECEADLAALANTLVDNGASGTIELAVAKITACDEEIKAAVVRCKRRQYSDALAALTKFNEDEAAATTKNEETKKAYDKKRDEAVAKNADCRKDADGVRAECAEGECCGQANRYDRDGTRMTIEVCGSPEDSTYTYWPTMAKGMAKAPQTEQWRYYCIAGAKDLAAGAAAVAGALYMAY